jgi:hypothetical protein
MELNKIKNLNDLRYRKLLLRTEIRFKEDEIKKQLTGLRSDLESSNLRGEITQAIISNPMMVINVARVAFNLVQRWRERKRKKQLRRKNK